MFEEADRLLRLLPERAIKNFSARQRSRSLCFAASSRIRANLLDSSGTLAERARSWLVGLRSDRGADSGMVGTCREGGRKSGDSS
jgi:hypothetical protein